MGVSLASTTIVVTRGGMDFGNSFSEQEHRKIRKQKIGCIIFPLKRNYSALDYM
jgi:hypothetical protein